jgi:hypothetical protein
MKLNHSETATSGSGDAFTIAATGKAFKILSDGLYADKLRAIVRELACNARDSHAAAGNPAPWSLHLPRDYEADYFELRDYGTGLSHDEVLNIYTRYFASTKTDSNAYVGQLGLGSKSPFSYTRSFTVKSYNGGICNTYNMGYDDTDTPRVELVQSEPTAETGLSVRFDTRRDGNRWATKAKEVLQWFEQKPVLTGTVINLEAPNSLMSGKTWQLFRNNQWSSIGPAAKMGGVVYPIDSNSLGDLTDLQSILFEMDLLLEFNIGDLDVAASREGLSYDPRTTKMVKDRIDAVHHEIMSAIQAQLCSASSEYAARKLWYAIVEESTYELRNLAKMASFAWNGIAIKDSIIEVPKDTLYPVHTGQEVRLFGQFSKVSSKLSKTIGFVCADKTEIVFNDLKKGGVGRVKNYHQNAGKQIYLFDAGTLPWQQMSKLMGDVPYTMASSLPAVPKVDKSLGNVEVWKIGQGYVRNGLTKIFSSELPAIGTKFYVNVKGFDVVLGNGQLVDSNRVADSVRVLQKLGVLANDTTVYGLRSAAYKKLAADNSNWVNYIEHVESKLNEPAIKSSIGVRLNSSALKEQIENQLSRCNCLKNLASNADDAWKDSIIDKESDLLKLFAMLSEMKVNNNSISSGEMASIKRIMPDMQIYAGEADHPVLQLIDHVIGKYRMLEHCSYLRFSDPQVRKDLANYVNSVDYSHVYVTLSFNG